MPNHEHHEHEAHHEERRESKPLTKNNQALIPVAVIVAGVIIAAAVIFGPKLAGNQGNGTQNQGQTQQGQPTQQANINDVKTAGEPFIGSPNAPVTVAYWSDFQCPFCDKFETETMPTLIKDYVDTGKVKIVFKDLQFLGSDSQTAGIMGRAVWSADPQSYFKWRTYLFDHQGQENSGWATEQKLLGIITDVGLNANQISSLISKDQSTYQSEIDADKQEGASMGIQSTPSFVIGDQLIVGAQPLSVFTQAIDSQLKNSGK
ncbi:MAG: thioredoxin domain-containing protein [Patescibacteria group bacterium]|nr:thioredoxin domain-containing protein [Patescibacteria group bacterium]